MIDIMKYYYKHICGLLFLALVTVGCSQDDVAAGDGEGGVGELTDSYVTLNFTMAFSGQGTRSNPTGGENGDGEEAGQDNENEISSAVAFLYQDADGVNSSANPEVTPIVFSKVTKNGDKYSTSPERVTLPNGGDYHIIVVANPGEDWWSAPLKLDDVRDHIQVTAWTETDGKYSNFLMSSENDGGGFSLASQPESAPLDINVDVERMAARIDYQAEGPINGSFGCEDGTVKILGAAIVNDYDAGSYLLKRVAPTVDGSVTYLGDEVAGEGANFVIDPKTVSGKAFSDYKDGTYYTSIIDQTDDWADPNVWADFVKEGKQITVDGEKWHRVGYTMENTSKPDADIEKTNTGVVFKAQFSPAVGTVTGSYDYDKNATFFSYRGVLYASMEDVMKAVYGEDVFSSFDDQIEKCEKWDDVDKFINDVLNPLDPSGYDEFLKDKDKVDANEAFSTAGLKWSEYMKAECGYSCTATADGKADVVLDQNGKFTRVVLRPYGVSTYENATCYYTWWVKHSNDKDNDDTKVGPMEYAIVRNNIYKLKVDLVAGLGGDVPGGTPESGDDIVIHVKVKDWTLLSGEEIIM